MFRQKAILVVEDDPIIAECLAIAVEAADGRVIGPVASVEEALSSLKGQVIAAAVLDANLTDGEVTRLAMRLAAQKVPFVIYTGTGLPTTLAAILPDLPVVLKPTPPAEVLARLADQMKPS